MNQEIHRSSFSTLSPKNRITYRKATLFFYDYATAWSALRKAHEISQKSKSVSKPLGTATSRWIALRMQAIVLGQIVASTPTLRFNIYHELMKFVREKKSFSGLEGIFTSLLTSSALYKDKPALKVGRDTWQEFGPFNGGALDEEGSFVIDLNGPTGIVTTLPEIQSALQNNGLIEDGGLGSYLADHAGTSLGIDFGSEQQEAGVGGLGVSLPTDPNQGMESDLSGYSTNLCLVAAGVSAGVVGSEAGPQAGAGFGLLFGAMCISAQIVGDSMGAKAAQSTPETSVTVEIGPIKSTPVNNTDQTPAPTPPSPEQPGGPDDLPYVGSAKPHPLSTESFATGSPDVMGITQTKPGVFNLSGAAGYRNDGQFKAGCLEAYFVDHPDAGAVLNVAHTIQSQGSHGGLVLPGETEHAVSSGGAMQASNAIAKPLNPALGGPINVVQPSHEKK